MTKEEALTKALNQLKRADQIIQSLCPQGYIHPALGSIHGAIVNVQEALAQPEQEPVAWTLLLTGEHTGMVGMAGEQFVGAPDYYQRVNVYTAPPQRKPLMDEEIEKLADDFLAYQIEDYQVSGVFTFARAIEAAHGIKENT